MHSDMWPFGNVFERLLVLGAIPAEQLTGAGGLLSAKSEEEIKMFLFLLSFSFLASNSLVGLYVLMCSDSASTLTTLLDVGQPSKNVYAPAEWAFECELDAQKVMAVMPKVMP